MLGESDEDPWHADRLVWPLLTTIEECSSEPWCEPLARHLGYDLPAGEGEVRRARRYAVAHRLAAVIAGYARMRPGMLASWSRHDGSDSDGHGGHLPSDLAWQPELWRRLIDRVGAQTPEERQSRAVRSLLEGEGAVGLPGRVSLFGHTRVYSAELELLDALGTHRDVHLWLPQASPSFAAELIADGPPPGPRLSDPSADRVAHRLLGSLGRESRELSLALGHLGVVVSTADPAATTSAAVEADPSSDTETGGGSLLGWLQGDIAANRLPSAAERAGRELAATDGSLQVHACHGPSRQTDALREVITGLLENDPTLEPRDIVVMCPDIEVYTPLIQARFGLGELDASGEARATHPSHGLRVMLADRAPSRANELLATAVGLVDLASGRVTASDIIDFATTEPVRRRFGFSDSDLEKLAQWASSAGIRWGIDTTTRASFAMEDVTQYTWRFGLDRILLGATTSTDTHPVVGSGYPVDDVPGDLIDLAGRMAELVDRLDTAFTAFAQATRPSEWLVSITDAVSSLAQPDQSAAWQLADFHAELARIADDAPELDESVALTLQDISALLGGRLSGRPSRTSFRTGSVTVCTMVPMRSVPHRVVCLLGVDDGVFPRNTHPHGDDVLAREPRTGERDARIEDRQLLLDAMMSATETFAIFYSGAKETSGAELPPAVPVGEILDAAERTAAGDVRARVLRRHPLQPHDVRNFAARSIDPTGTAGFSFDEASAEAARTVRSGAKVAHPIAEVRLKPLPAGDVALDDLKSFFQHPVRAFGRRRLGLSLPGETSEVDDAIPIELDGLAKWHIGDRILTRLLAGEAPVDVARTERLTGALPPGGIGYRALREVGHRAETMTEASADLRAATKRSIDIEVDLGSGRTLTGTVSGVFGNRLVTVRYGSLKPAHRLLAWIDLLALSASDPDQSWWSHALGQSKAGAHEARVGPLDHRAIDWLRDLVDVADTGLARALPIPASTACAYAESYRASADHARALEAAEKKWRTDRYATFGFPGEDDDAWHRLAYGDPAELVVLDQAGLGEWATRVWSPLLELERTQPL